MSLEEANFMKSNEENKYLIINIWSEIFSYILKSYGS
jgi:hypothetical protein